MKTEQWSEVAHRAALHAALGEPARLAIVDLLADNDATASAIGAALNLPSNLFAHHLRTLENVGLVTRRQSEGDRRRWYLHLEPDVLADLGGVRPIRRTPQRLLFVCTANSARSHLAAALWRRASRIPAASAGTHPAARIHPGAIAAAGRAELPMPRLRPRLVDEVASADDLVVTVCDRAHEELPLAGDWDLAPLHWSVPDPVPGNDPDAFDGVLDDLAHRVTHLAGRLSHQSGDHVPPLPSGGL